MGVSNRRDKLQKQMKRKKTTKKKKKHFGKEKKAQPKRKTGNSGKGKGKKGQDKNTLGGGTEHARTPDKESWKTKRHETGVPQRRGNPGGMGTTKKSRQMST